MTYFNRTLTTEDRAAAAINAGYRIAGVTPPSNSTGALDAIRDEPTATDIALKLAAEAHTTTDPTAWLEDALDRIARARAADELRAGLAKVLPSVRRTEIPGLTDRAATDLAPAVARTVAALADAATELDPTEPLSVNAAVRDDTTRALKAAHTALAALGTYASIHTSRPITDVPPPLARALPILDLPDCVKEATTPTPYDTPRTVNADDLAGTMTVRQLARDLETDADLAIINVARGNYPGVSLTLATVAGLKARAANAQRAHRRRTAQADEVRRIRVTA